MRLTSVLYKVRKTPPGGHTWRGLEVVLLIRGKFYCRKSTLSKPNRPVAFEIVDSGEEYNFHLISPRKYRRYKEVTPDHLHVKRLEFRLEERNMFLLRHPYLTVEQQAFLKKPPTEHEKNVELLKNFVWAKHEYLGDRMGYLKINDKWED